VALRNPFGSKPTVPEASAGPLDQQIFVYKNPTPPKTAESAKQEPEKPKVKDILTIADLKPPSLKREFDVSQDALYQANFRFTQEEKEVLEDLKLQLSREMDNRVDKNDILRLGLHMIIEDYKQNGAKSYLIKKLLRKTSR
jgi:hypothetical protein